MKRKPKIRIFIYPNNTSCVGGRFVGAAGTAALLDRLGIDVDRSYDTLYNTPDARIVAFGNSIAPAHVIAAGAALTRRSRSML